MAWKKEFIWKRTKSKRSYQTGKKGYLLHTAGNFALLNRSRYTLIVKALHHLVYITHVYSWETPVSSLHRPSIRTRPHCSRSRRHNGSGQHIHDWHSCLSPWRISPVVVSHTSLLETPNKHCSQRYSQGTRQFNQQYLLQVSKEAIGCSRADKCFTRPSFYFKHIRTLTHNGELTGHWVTPLV